MCVFCQVFSLPQFLALILFGKTTSVASNKTTLCGQSARWEVTPSGAQSEVLLPGRGRGLALARPVEAGELLMVPGDLVTAPT